MNKNTELVKRTEVEGTPFIVITTPDGGSVVTLGKYRVSQPMETAEEAVEYIKTKDWNLILSVVMLMVDEQINTKDQEEILNHEKQQKNENGKNKD